MTDKPDTGCPLWRTVAAVAAAVVAAAGGYVLWSRSGRGESGPYGPDVVGAEECFGADSRRGNLLAVQPCMWPGDYSAEEAFFRRLDCCFARARELGWMGPKTVVVLPEYVGTFLAVAGEKRSVYRARSLAQTAAIVALSNLPACGAALAHGCAPDRLAEAVMRMKAPRTAHIFNNVMSRLASTYQVTLVAGTLVLPTPEVKDGRLVAGTGPLWNVSVVYGPDGRAMPPVVPKTRPVPDELAFTRPARCSPRPVFQTPAGKLGVLVCADAWHPEDYEDLVRQGAEFVAVPSYTYTEGSWQRPWNGYVTTPLPADVDSASVGRLTGEEALMKYAMPARLPRAGIRYGINVHMRGRLWEIGSDGRTLAVVDGRPCAARNVSGAALTNVWL